MTNKLSKVNIDWLGKSFQAGHVNISLNGEEVGEVAIENGSFQIDIPDNLKTTIAIDKLLSKMKELSIAHSISGILSSLGLGIDIH